MPFPKGWERKLITDRFPFAEHRLDCLDRQRLERQVDRRVQVGLVVGCRRFPER